MSQRGRAIKTIALIVCGLVLLSGMILEVARRGRFAVPLSTFSTGPRGTGALYALLRERGLRPCRWTRELRGLPAASVLIAAGEPFSAPERPLGRLEREALLSWLRGGGTLLVFGATRYVPKELGLRLQEPPTRQKPEGQGKAFWPWDDPVLKERLRMQERLTRAALESHPLVRGLDSVTLRGAGSLDVTGAPAGTWTVVAGGDKEPVALWRSFGRGQVLAVASASLLTNEWLAKGDHAELVLRAVRLGRGPVLYDEYHLGMGSAPSVSGYLRGQGLAPVILQLLVVMALLVWRAGARFGAPRPHLAPNASDATSYVDALGRIYARAGDVRASMDRVLGDALSRVAARHGLRTTEPNALARALREHGRERAARSVEQAQARLTALSKPSVGPRQLVEFERGLDRDLAPALAVHVSEDGG